MLFLDFVPFPFCFITRLNSFPLGGLVELRLMGELSVAAGNWSAMVIAVNKKVPVLLVL